MAKAAERAPLFRVSGLCVSWHGEPIVRDVSLTLGRGEMVCLVGRSGCGKTTLFHGLAGLVRPDAGTVDLDGVDITGKPGHVSYMLQKDLLLPQRTIIDNVALPLLVKGTPKKRAREEAAALFGEFGIAGTEDKYPSELSGGMRQRAALLRTSMSDSPVVLMDEPFSALDALTRADMQQWLLAMMERLGFASILITHDVDEAIALADRISVLGSANDDGKLPSTVVATIPVERPRADRADFLLTPDALDIKRQVLSYL